MKLFGREIGRDDLARHIGRLDQIGGIEAFTLSAGRAQGVRALRLRTGTGLAVTTLADRALDLSYAEYRGLPLCWRSPNGDVSPAFYEPEGDGFLRSFFGGLMTTAGLTNFGPGGTDRYGTVGLHGRIDNLPAEEVSWSQSWRGDELELEISGTTRETKVFGPDLALTRRWVSRLGADALHLHDSVRNEGFAPSPHMILYHCNAGFPLLADGARLYISHSAIRPRDAAAAAGRDVWDQVTAPQPGFKEQVFIHTPVPLADGRAAALLHNPALCGGLALLIRFDPRQLPALIQWRMLDEGTYVMGIEPANCPTIEGRMAAEQCGTLPFLGPGESRQYDLEFHVLTDAAEIGRLIEEIAGASRRAGFGTP